MVLSLPIGQVVVKQEMEVNFIVLIGKKNVIITCVSSGPPGRNTGIELPVQEPYRKHNSQVKLPVKYEERESGVGTQSHQVQCVAGTSEMRGEKKNSWVGKSPILWCRLIKSWLPSPTSEGSSSRAMTQRRVPLVCSDGSMAGSHQGGSRAQII